MNCPIAITPKIMYLLLPPADPISLRQNESYVLNVKKRNAELCNAP